ncbi:microtubule-associated protein futsch isoform X2 [Belonocnema kinseyi]|uniref:microtubule-associated protein futsch isoform X2 n=1 Tax=Belonocnema kinseyi TaxID=2817044 RepID=UPI00143D51BE|nr:microtubule-associated protein futsch isoform X2 [Belonocnema kinseyi]
MMRRPPLRTYDRKNNGKLNFSTYQKPALNFIAVEREASKKKEFVDDSLEDPFDTTFDRLLKQAKNQPPKQPPNLGLSYINSSSEGSYIQTPARPKILTSESEEDLKLPTPKKKPRLKKSGSKPVKSKTKTIKSSKLVKEKAAVDDGDKVKTSTKPSRKKTDEENLKPPTKRKRRRISSSSEDSPTDLVLDKRNSILESSSEDEPRIPSNLADFSFTQSPEIIKSLPNIADDNEPDNIENVENYISNTEKLDKRSNEFSPKSSFHSEESVSTQKDFYSSKTDSVISSKIVFHKSLKECSVVVKRCDSMIRKKKGLFNLKPCSVKIPRLDIKSKRKVKALISKVLERKSKDETELEKVVENEIVLTNNISIKETSSRKSLLEGIFDMKSQLSESLPLKDCVVKLTRINPPRNSFPGTLYSSTPFVRRKNDNLILEGFSPIAMEISNIAAVSESFRTPPSEIESTVVTSRKVSEPRLQLEDINSNNNNNNNHHSNPPPTPFEFNSEILNASSDYSAIDWTTVSLSDSQCIKFREELQTPVPANKTDEDLSATVPLSVSKDFEPITKPFDFVAERNLNLIPEYEKSASLFDDTMISEIQYTREKKSPLKIDEKSLELSPMMPSLTKMSPLKDVFAMDSSSILNQSDFKGFESPTMRKLSPMTAIPASIVNSLSYEDTDKSFILESEKGKHIRSLAFEKRLSGGPSPRKCLNFEEEPKICDENFISLGKDSFGQESFSKESINSESFTKESIKDSLIESFDPDSFSQNSRQNLLSEESTNKDSFSQESISEVSITCDSETKLGSKLELADSTSESSYKLEVSQPSVRSASILLEDEKGEIKEESEKTVEENAEEILEGNEEEISEEKEEEIAENEAVITSEINFRESIGSLNRLKDPIRITHQRKRYKNWGMQLTAITENVSRRCSENEAEICPLVEKVEVDPILEHTVSVTNNASLNNGILQSCVKQQDDPRTPQKCGGGALSLNGNSEYESRVDRLSTFGSISPNRFVKRISIRVVPDVKKLDGVEDTQFLEAYGISSNQPIKTVPPCFSSLEEDRKFVESQETLLHSNIQFEESVIKTTDTPPLVTAKDVVLERCRQDDYLPFDECYSEKFLQHCRKIGEGVYGEVFLHDNGSDNSVIKIIPIEGDVNVNGEPQKKFHEILSEIVIAKELHDLRFGEKNNTAGFVEVKSIKCIIGRYPAKLVELWKVYDDEKKSENDCPSMFDENQLYISLELGHGGQDLEAFVFQNASESYAVFLQTAFALAVAEQSLEFEHRDLHWGNVLISRSRKSQVSYKLDDQEICFPSSGVKVAIIDFTLSRMSYQNCCIFNDLALDPALFTAEGEYQFEIYRLMRDKTENQWQRFEPFTNVLWLHYTVDKMINLVRYKKKTTKIHKAAIEQLKELKDQILNYDSAFDLIRNCDKFASLYDLNTSGLSPF